MSAATAKSLEFMIIPPPRLGLLFLSLMMIVNVDKNTQHHIHNEICMRATTIIHFKSHFDYQDLFYEHKVYMIFNSEFLLNVWKMSL